MPAGSVRPGETPEDAALCEAREETGLTDFKIVRKLGETEYDISPYRFEIQRRHVFHLELTEPTPQRWGSQEDHDGESGPTHFECFWVPLEAAHILQSGQGALLGRLFDQSTPQIGLIFRVWSYRHCVAEFDTMAVGRAADSHSVELGDTRAGNWSALINSRMQLHPQPYTGARPGSLPRGRDSSHR